MPTCWVNVAREPQRYENPQPEYLIEARAREFGVPFACANKFGMETDKVGYCGRSLITGRDGAVLYEGPGHGEALGVAEVEPRAASEPDVSPGWEVLLETVEAGAHRAAPDDRGGRRGVSGHGRMRRRTMPRSRMPGSS